ncbi:lamin tail domain-containing protein [Candidatus Woesebacteria bacterium]|nr:lamin tail domain-containing protein [Candidatus Woesebacteria bacterium]MCD8506696.1 lamin tail domain-containing protein [Candidatus Woesebacteria bacterium]MCD8527602.1 lamin tail domain-containing protein [Candidatus Woesebacteria bacterium]MCD8546427.1 lamin tail domain-containing protein [Candidatus Woesebacteria bacterium]
MPDLEWRRLLYWVELLFFWVFCWRVWAVAQVFAFTNPAIQVLGLTFSTQVSPITPLPFSETATVLAGNWFVSSPQVVDDPASEVLGRSLRYCHTQKSIDGPYQSAECSSADREKVFWNSGDTEFVWRQGDIDAKLFFTLSSTASPQDLYDLVISEVAWSGSYDGEGSHSTDEWIELYNPTGNTWNLHGVKLEGIRRSGASYTFPAGYAIAPHSFFVIARHPAEESVLSSPPDSVLSSLSLSNTNASIRLSNSDGMLLDSVPSGEWKAGANDTVAEFRASAQRNLWHLTPEWDSWFTCQSAKACGSGAVFTHLESQQTYATPWQASRGYKEK